MIAIAKNEKDVMDLIDDKIRAISRRYSSDPSEIDDLEQIARIKAWRVLEKNPDASLPYVVTAIKNEFFGVFRLNNTAKRNFGKRPLSLDASFRDEDGKLQDFIGEENKPVCSEEIMEGFIDGLRKRFGRHYIKGIKSQGGYKDKARQIVRAVIEEVHKIPVKEIPERVNYRFFVDAKLEPFLWVFYKNSPFDAVMDAYSDVLIPWNYKRKPTGFWKNRGGYRRARKAIEWFCKKHEVLEQKDCKKVGYDDFERDSLSGMLEILFNHSPYLALKVQFPGLKPWQALQTPGHCFDKRKNRVEALSSYLVDRGFPLINGFSPEEIYELGLRTKVTCDDIESYGLRGLTNRYNSNTYEMFCDLFPGKILPWTIYGSKKAWRNNPNETAAKAVRWVFDKYLKIPQFEIPSYATCDLFWRVGFSGIMTNRRIGYNSSPYRAVDSAYPKRFTRGDFDRHRDVSRIDTKELKKPWKKFRVLDDERR